MLQEQNIPFCAEVKLNELVCGVLKRKDRERKGEVRILSLVVEGYDEEMFYRLRDLSGQFLERIKLRFV